MERENYPELSLGPFITIQDPFELNVNVGKVLRMNVLAEQMKHSLKHAYELCQRFQGGEFAKLLVALFTDVQKCPKPTKESKAAAKKPTPTAGVQPAGGGGAVANGTVVEKQQQPGPSSSTNSSSGSSSTSNSNGTASSSSTAGPPAGVSPIQLGAREGHP